MSEVLETQNGEAGNMQTKIQEQGKASQVRLHCSVFDIAHMSVSLLSGVQHLDVVACIDFESLQIRMTSLVRVGIVVAHSRSAALRASKPCPKNGAF